MACHRPGARRALGCNPRRPARRHRRCRGWRLATAVYANAKHQLVVIPALAWGGGIGAAILIGAVTGLWPALRAARMSPTQALWSM